MYVANYNLAAGTGAVLIHNATDRVHCVLAMPTTGATPKRPNELNYALEQHRLVIPIVRLDVPGALS
jgi:hypothetical protein